MNKIVVPFIIKILNDNIFRKKPSEYNKNYIHQPYFLVGLDNSLNGDIVRIQFTNNKQIENTKYQLIGTYKNKIPYDSYIVFYLFTYDENETNTPINHRVSELRLEVKELSKKKDFKLLFKNKSQQDVCEIYISFEIDNLLFEYPKNNELYIINENDSFINSKIMNEIKKMAYNRKKLFKNFYPKTEDIFVYMDFNFNRKRILSNYISFNIQKSNEEFWENILYNVLFINWIEIGKEKYEINNEKEFKKSMNKFVDNLSKKQRMNIMIDMFTTIVTNLTYSYDYVYDIKKKERIAIEDFSSPNEGTDDCEGFTNFLLYSMETFSKNSPYKNNLLTNIKNDYAKYIKLMCLEGVKFKSITESINKSSDTIGAHMNCVFVRKKWFFNKLLLNPEFKDEEIQETIKKIIKSEEESGNLDSDDYPNLLIAEGTGFFNPSGDENPLYKSYRKAMQYISNLDELNQKLKFRIYHTLKKESPFFQYMFTGITNFFINHPKYPINIPGITFSYKISKNEEKMNYLNDSNSRIYGAKYIDVMNSDDSIELITLPPFNNFDDTLKLIKKLTNSDLRNLPLYIEKKEDNRITFKKRYENYSVFPNISKENEILIEKEYKKLFNDNIKYNVDYSLLNEDGLIYFQVYPVDMISTMKELKELSKVLNIRSIRKVENTNVSSYYEIIIKIN